VDGGFEHLLAEPEYLSLNIQEIVRYMEQINILLKYYEDKYEEPVKLIDDNLTLMSIKV